MGGAEHGPFHDHLNDVGWLLLHGGGVADAREFARMPAGPERDLIVAAIRRAEDIRLDELRQFAEVMARLMGAGSGT